MLFQLPPLSDTFTYKYRDSLLPGLKDRIINGKGKNRLSKANKEILIPNFGTTAEDLSKLNTLLVGDPKESKALSDRLYKSFSFNPAKAKSFKKKLEKIFDYQGVISQNKSLSYWIAENTQRNTCTYCNRQYVHSIERISKKGGKKYLARPAFDHWFTKGKHPLLSLNIYNLIPSCTTCNSSLKGTADGNLGLHIHPYIKENFNFTFRAYLKPGSLTWGLKIDRTKGSKIDNTIRDFATEELYSFHEDLEVKDIMEFAEAYPESFLQDILVYNQNKGKKSITQQEAYRMLFGAEYHSDRFLDRPLSKLKHDLLCQIGAIAPSSAPALVFNP